MQRTWAFCRKWVDIWICRLWIHLCENTFNCYCHMWTECVPKWSLPEWSNDRKYCTKFLLACLAGEKQCCKNSRKYEVSKWEGPLFVLNKSPPVQVCPRLLLLSYSDNVNVLSILFFFFLSCNLHFALKRSKSPFLSIFFSVRLSQQSKSTESA